MSHDIEKLIGWAASGSDTHRWTDTNRCFWCGRVCTEEYHREAGEWTVPPDCKTPEPDMPKGKETTCERWPR